MNELFLRSTIRFYGSNELLFNMGSKAENIFVVLNGLVETGFKYNNSVTYFLDIMGPGSIIGLNYVLFSENYSF